MPRKGLPPPKRTIHEVMAAAAVRRNAMIEMRSLGMSYQAIADKVGVCKNRARIIILRHE